MSKLRRPKKSTARLVARQLAREEIANAVRGQEKSKRWPEGYHIPGSRKK